jgi:hypothetical protein
VPSPPIISAGGRWPTAPQSAGGLLAWARDITQAVQQSYSSIARVLNDRGVSQHVHAYDNTGTLAWANNAWTAIGCNTEDFAIGDALHSTVTNNDRFTATNEGVHRISAAALIAAAAGGLRELAIWKSTGGGAAAEIRRLQRVDNPAAAAVIVVTGSADAYLLRGDYLQARVFQNSGGPLTNAGGTTLGLTYVTVTRL